MALDTGHAKHYNLGVLPLKPTDQGGRFAPRTFGVSDDGSFLASKHDDKVSHDNGHVCYADRVKSIYNHDCTRCPLHKTAKTVCVEGSGFGFGEYQYNPRAMILGEAPGASEDEQGEPFVGVSGQLLRKTLTDIIGGPQFIKPFITNTVKCRPPGNRDPLPEEADACFTYLQEEIELVNPVAVMTLGNPALKAITGKTGITKVAGLWTQVDHYRGYPLLVIPNYHPAYIMRNRDKTSFFEEVVADFVAVWYYGLNHTPDETWRYARP